MATIRKYTYQKIQQLAFSQGIILPCIKTSACNSLIKRAINNKSKQVILSEKDGLMLQAFCEINYPVHYGQGRNYTTNNGTVLSFFTQNDKFGILVLA